VYAGTRRRERVAASVRRQRPKPATTTEEDLSGAYVMIYIFDYFGRFSAILANFLRFWPILGDFGQF
jgi:hypothetical protein